MPDSKHSLTTEVEINANNSVVAEILHDRYARMDPGEVRAELEALYGAVMNDEELNAKFVIDIFDAPYAHLVSKDTGAHFTAAYTETPRFYFLLKAAEKPDEQQ